MQTIDEWMDGRYRARMKREEREQAKLEKQWDRAERLIGELCREGETIYYINLHNGKTKESANRFELVEYLAKKGYI